MDSEKLLKNIYKILTHLKLSDVLIYSCERGDFNENCDYFFVGLRNSNSRVIFLLLDYEVIYLDSY